MLQNRSKRMFAVLGKRISWVAYMRLNCHTVRVCKLESQEACSCSVKRLGTFRIRQTNEWHNHSLRPKVREFPGESVMLVSAKA